MKRFVAGVQDQVSRVLGLDPARRPDVVRAMLHRPPGDAAGYWLQLVIAAALATLGLALDSTAVVIGAMLIAPLMRPIVELSMGLATGSTPLVFRTLVRSIASIAVVVLAAAAFTLFLPFHEVTRELLARTAPTMLDLFVAAACAVAGAYAIVIASSDVATTAAGTSIGISLVPPLCTAGYGLSIGDWEMAKGAALLFTANITGIITVASAVFVVVGFGQVDIREQERTLDDDGYLSAATRAGRVVSRRTPGRLAMFVRVGVPLALLSAIAFPLRSAVDEMSRQSRVRQHVRAMLGGAERIVQYSLDQAARPMALRVVMVGEAASARTLEARLRRQLGELGARNAAISVWAVTEASQVSALSARLDDLPAIVAPTMSPAPVAIPSLDARIRAIWPAAAGSLLGVWTSDATPPRARVVHLQDELGASGRQLLAVAVAHENRLPVIDEVALPVVEAKADVSRWLVEAMILIGKGEGLESVRFCIEVPPPARPREDPDVAVARAAIGMLARRPDVTVRQADRFRITPQLDACEVTAPAIPGAPPPVR